MITQKITTPTETDAARADKINNCTARTLERLRACVDMTNTILSKGDKTAILAALDPDVVAVVSALATLVTAHTTASATTDLV